MTAVWPSWKLGMHDMTSRGGQTWTDTGHQCETQSRVGTQPVAVPVSLVSVERGCVVSACFGHLFPTARLTAEDQLRARGIPSEGRKPPAPVPSYVDFSSHLSSSWFSALRPRPRNCQSKSFAPLGVRGEKEGKKKGALGQS